MNKRIWHKEGTDYVCNLGSLKRAIVIRLFTPNFPSMVGKYYGIAHASFLPFNKEEHARKFDDPIDCMEFAESVVLDWMQSLFLNEDKQNLKSITSDQNPFIPIT